MGGTVSIRSFNLVIAVWSLLLRAGSASTDSLEYRRLEEGARISRKEAALQFAALSKVKASNALNCCETCRDISSAAY
jgi:hypothetical protein